MENCNTVKRITKPIIINIFTFILLQQLLNIAYALGKGTTLWLRSESYTDHLEKQKQ